MVAVDAVNHYAEGGYLMQGFPKHLNTKEDYLYVKDNFPEGMWQGAFRSLLDERMKWFNIGVIPVGEVGITDETHKVITEKEFDGSIVSYQYELKEDQNCTLLRLGFTVNEVMKILST